MRTQTVVSLCALIVICFLVGTADGQPVYFAATGHYYERVDEELTWEEAKVAAELCSYLGVSGHLVTITSQAENDFLTDNLLLGLGNPCYCGGYQPPDSLEPDGGWTWVTGEPWEFANWAAGEPNDWANDEDCLEVKPDGSWNDAQISGTPRAYIVEYPVPEPATLSLALAALGALGLLRKRD